MSTVMVMSTVMSTVMVMRTVMTTLILMSTVMILVMVLRTLTISYTHLRAHMTVLDLVRRLMLYTNTLFIFYNLTLLSLHHHSTH